MVAASVGARPGEGGADGPTALGAHTAQRRGGTWHGEFKASRGASAWGRCGLGRRTSLEMRGGVDAEAAGARAWPEGAVPSERATSRCDVARLEPIST
jgi:hypothetical protein